MCKTLIRKSHLICIKKFTAALQMFTGVYRVIKEFFCNICRETPVIFTDCREIAGKTCKYYRVFPVDKAEKPFS
jgi:hypothetical protein